MSRVDTLEEFAVEVPGRGYLGILDMLSDDPDTGVTNPDDAVKMLKSGMRKYESMGCPEIAATLRVVKRTITLTRGDWVPVQIEGQVVSRGVELNQ